MIDNLKTLNTSISTLCNEGQSLNGCIFYENAMQELKEFPAVGTKLTLVKTLPTNSGRIIPIKNEVVLFVADLLENHDSLVDMYESVLDKLNIMFVIAKARTDDDIEMIDTMFLGNKKAVIVAVTIDI